MVFPQPYPTLLSADFPLEEALDKALTETRASHPEIGANPRVAISIAAVEGADDYRHAGLNYGGTYYSASLLKAAIPYCAYQLRTAVEDAGNAADAVNGPTTYAAARQVIDPLASTAVPALAAAGIPVPMRVPKYETIFGTIPVIGGGVSVHLNANFEALMRDALVISSNAAAAACIKALGYGWINGVLAAGGFFHDAGKQGIWLCGTFDGTQPAVRISSVNDGQVAQAMTTFDMANMYAHILRGSLVDMSASGDVASLLRDTASGPDASWMDGAARPGTGSTEFTVSHTKIGLGPLKTGQDVYSEASVIVPNGTDKQFIVVWQNAFGNQHRAMSFLVERTVAHYLSP